MGFRSRLFGVAENRVVQQASPKWWTALVMACVVSALTTSILEWLRGYLSKKRAKRDWDEKDFQRLVQAALYTVDHAPPRVEKRTLFEVPLEKMLHYNPAIVDRVTEAVTATTSEEPFVTEFLPVMDRWTVLNAALNLVSSCHAGAHFDHAATPDSVPGKWYVLAYISEKHIKDSFFIADAAKATTREVWAHGSDDSTSDMLAKRSLKGRIFIVPEEDLQRVSELSILDTNPQAWQNERHYHRWLMVQKIAELYKRQNEETSNPEWKHLLRLSIPAPRHRNASGSLKTSTSAPALPQSGSPRLNTRRPSHDKSVCWAHPLSADGFLQTYNRRTEHRGPQSHNG